jgi:hypothetical protein
MLYKYCKTDGFDILKNCRLRLNRIENFNDPFELVFGIDEDTAPSNIKKEYEENPNIINAWAHTLDEQNISCDKTSPEDVLEKFIKFQIKDFNRVTKILWEHWNEKMGIVCFSESSDVIQMWAHYTENHKGIVVGIEESEFVKDKEALVTVCYRDKMVLFPVTGTPERLDQYAAKYIPEVVGRKESNWSYEKEIRIYTNLDEKDIDGNYYLKKIPASSIKEIYLGLRSDETTKLIAECIRQREEYKHLKIYKMGKHESAYKLKPQEIFI